MPTTLKVFTSEEQLNRVQRMLATRVVQLAGRKLEEGDWTEIYCSALGIKDRGWSNIGIDVIFENRGVEIKMLRFKSRDISTACGTSMMHPSLTRSLRIDANGDPNDQMRKVFQQYKELVENRAAKVRKEGGLKENAEVEMRSGWLLWQDSLRQFLYFEEPTVIPNCDDYTAIWHENEAKGQRKESKSLWVFRKGEPQDKRYSITTNSGAKIQPYFDIPAPNDPNLYIFTVIGEHINDQYVYAWVTARTRRDLVDAIGSFTPNSLSQAILSLPLADFNHGELSEIMKTEELASPIEISTDAYLRLCTAFRAANDDLRFRALAAHFKGKK